MDRQGRFALFAARQKARKAEPYVQRALREHIEQYTWKSE
jgi:hypothetical protein